jgi:peptidoglycan/LPS O-acetylase OafA/YrhL
VTIDTAAHAQGGAGAPAHQRLAYLPGLDGVRAFAVGAVMMYHAGLSAASGGFMGVDTFFVLSGFLITSLLVSEWRTTMTIRLAAFWARRARRLLPALFLMLLLVAFFASVVVPKGTYPALRLDALSTLFYVSNWHFVLTNSDYFNQSAAASPLIHTWSLAVEEQFYVVWPLVVLGLLRLTRSLRPLLVLCCAAAIGSALEMDLLFHHGATVNRLYLGTDTRAQCLFIGATLAVVLAMPSRRGQASGRLATDGLWTPAHRAGTTACAAAGVAGAGLSFFLWTHVDSFSNLPYQGGFFLIGLATAGVILAVVGAPRSPVPWFLSLAPIRYLGRISYGLYIWHWPIFIWLNAARTGLEGNALFAVRAATTGAVAAASYHLVEAPIRQGSLVRRWRAWVALPTGVVAVVAALVAATTGVTGAATIPPSAAPPTTQHGQGAGPGVSAHGPPVRVLLIGDSTATTLGEGLGEVQVEARYGYHLTDNGVLGCGVVEGPLVEVMGARDIVNSLCAGPVAPGTPVDKQPLPHLWLQDIATARPNVVMLLAGRWEVVDREYKGRWTNILHPALAAYVKHQLEIASNVITGTGVRLVFLTAPCTSEPEQPDGAAWPESNPARVAAYNKLVRQVAALHPQTDTVVDLNAAACPGGHYTVTLHGQTIRSVDDGVHFTPAGGVVLAPVLMPAVVAAGRAQRAAAAASAGTEPPPAP